MHNQPLFCLAFFCQIVLISGWMARKSVSNIRALQQQYPPTEYPRLYPLPPKHYERVQRRFLIASTVVGGLGLVILAVLVGTPRDGAWDHAIAIWYGMLQYLPLLFWEISRRAELQLMRDSATTRTAQLTPRRMLDVVPRGLLVIAVVVYLLLLAFVPYVNRFDYEWFGGYWNVGIMTVMNLGFAATLFFHVNGKKLDPYLDPEDRLRQLTQLARLLLLISIAATVFAMLSISLKAFDFEHLKGVSHSLYFQLLALLAFSTQQPRNLDYTVYREGHSAA